MVLVVESIGSRICAIRVGDVIYWPLVQVEGMTAFACFEYIHMTIKQIS